MEFIKELSEALYGAVEAVLQAHRNTDEAESLTAMEQGLQAVLHEVGNYALGEWLNVQTPKYPAARVACACGGQATYVRQREAVSITLYGRVHYRRAYYQCDCGYGQYPLDRRLGIVPGQMSAEVKTLAALLGVQQSYATSSATLARLLPLDVSPNSIRAACQDVGDSVLAEEADLLVACQDLHQQTATQRQQVPPERIYLSLDGFHGPFLDGWHEVKAGVFWQVDVQGKVVNRHYFVDTAAAEPFGELVWAKAWQLGADLSPQLVIIADGATWLWQLADRLFPNAIQIVDWFHASSYLAKIAADAFGEGTPEAKIWFNQHQTLLYHGHLASLLRACRAMRPQAPTTADAACHYFAHHRTRLRYPKYRALGLQIGSGVMESACKQLGTLRLKLPGARWSEPGARSLAKARAAFLSDPLHFAPFATRKVA